MIILRYFGVAKPALGLLAFAVVDPLQVTEGIATWQPAVTAGVCLCCGICCWRLAPGGRLEAPGRLLGWLWVLAAGAWSSRPLRELFGDLPWWVDSGIYMVALLVPLGLLLGAQEVFRAWLRQPRVMFWRPVTFWGALANSPLAAMLRARRPSINSAGCLLVIAIGAAFLTIAPESAGEWVEVLVYGAAWAAPVASAWMMWRAR